jgi:hypothetical protein
VLGCVKCIQRGQKIVQRWKSTPSWARHTDSDFGEEKVGVATPIENSAKCGTIVSGRI